VREKKLLELQTEYDQMVKDAEEAVNTDAGESADAQVFTKYRYILLMRQ
jgi:hypothetical protein